MASRRTVASRGSGSDAVSAITKGVGRLELSSRESQRREPPRTGSTKSTRRSLSSAASSNPDGNSLSANSLSRLFIDKKIRNVVVMAGAGISTPSGIPDFRTPGTGLYDNLSQYSLPYPEAVFDIEYFAVRPKAFFTLAKELLPDSGKYKPNYVHYFLRLLHEKGVLLRVYTQNIDGLERLAGVPPNKLVEAHGTFATATCTSCGLRQDGELVKADILLDKIPRCPTARCKGIVKPDIVFFGENLPRRFYLHAKDFPLADLVIVMGTSLEVEPFAGILEYAKRDVPRLLINRELVGPFRSKSRVRNSDVAMIGDLVENVQSFAKMIGWDDEIVQLMAERDSCNKLAVSAHRGPPATVATSEAGSSNSIGTQQAPGHSPSCKCQATPPTSTSAAIVTSPVRAIHTSSGTSLCQPFSGSLASAPVQAAAAVTIARTSGRGSELNREESVNVVSASTAGSITSLVSARKFWMDSVASYKLPQLDTSVTVEHSLSRSSLSSESAAAVSSDFQPKAASHVNGSLGHER